MNIRWAMDACGDGWLAEDANRPGDYLFHIGVRGAEDITACGRDRYCVFDACTYSGYLGDIDINLPEEAVKAVALVMWRMRDNA